MKLEGQGPGLFNAGGGTIELTDDSVVINKKNTDFSGGGGLLSVALSVATSTRGAFTLPYSAVHSVSISEGGWGSPPYIQVLAPGEGPVSDSDGAMKSPSCLVFKKAVLPDFKKLKSELERRAVAAKQKHLGAGQPVSVADEIAKYGKLLGDGLITQDEFDRKKKQLLGL